VPVRLIVVRHAHAEPGEPDELRPLSARGRDEAAALAERLAAEAPVLVLSSPLLRARETAAPIAKAAGAELRVDERLSPGATAADCSLVVGALAGIEADFPPAGHVAVDL
jgi:phosphohistidine phosphatase SixA